MSKDLDAIANGVVEQVKMHVHREAVSRVQSLERRVVDLEERMRELDQKKAHIRNFRSPHGYVQKVMGEGDHITK